MAARSITSSHLPLRTARIMNRLNPSACCTVIVGGIESSCRFTFTSMTPMRIVAEPATQDYGEEYWADRSYGALDPEGHTWLIAQRVRNGLRAGHSYDE